MRPASQRPKGDAETKVLCPARGTWVPPGARHGCDREVMNAEQAIKPIVVGVDGSTSSIDALRYAARMASALNAPLEVLTVWSYPPLSEYPMVVEWSPERDAEEIQNSAIAQAFGDEPPALLARRIAPGPVTPRLIDDSERAQMLALGSRGQIGSANDRTPITKAHLESRPTLENT